MKELIEFLEKRGLKKQADSLRNGYTYLSLYSNNIGDVEAKELTAVLKTNSTLKMLDLRYNSIGDIVAKELAVMLKTNSTLKMLDLRCNSIGDSGTKELATVLKSSTITMLNLEHNNIGDIGAKELAKALKTNSTITMLNLNYNKISSSGVKEFTAALKTNHTLTSLGVNYTGGIVAKEFAAVLKTNHTLTSLTLGYMDDLGANAIADALKKNNFLLNFDNISKESTIIKSIDKKIKYNNELVKKLALLLKSSFSDENNPVNIIKIASATKFYEKINKNILKVSLKHFFQEQKVSNNIESILFKMDNFIKTHSFLIAGVYKDVKTAFFSKYNIPDEIIDNIASYLENEKWGIEAETKHLGGNDWMANQL